MIPPTKQTAGSKKQEVKIYHTYIYICMCDYVCVNVRFDSIMTTEYDRSLSKGVEYLPTKNFDLNLFVARILCHKGAIACVWSDI